MLRILQSLVDLLEQNALTVHTMPFGWNKRWHADVLDGEWEQRVTHLQASRQPSIVTVSGETMVTPRSSAYTAS